MKEIFYGKKGATNMNKIFKHALCCGRYQNFQNMHLNNIRLASQLAESVTVMVGSAQAEGTERNPFHINTRLKAINLCTSNLDNVKVFPMVDMTDETDICFEWGDFLLNQVMINTQSKPDLIIYGDDGRENDPILWFRPEVKSGIHFLMIPRNEFAISGTKMRKYMAENNVEEWKKEAPIQTWDLYSDMRKSLMEIPFYKQMK